MITLVIPTIPPRARLLDRALASVREQAMQPAVVLVEPDLLREGPAAVRNRALGRVDTEFVAWLDDDDELYPDHLRLLARFARLTGVDVAYPGYDVVGGDDPVGCFGLPFDAGLLRRRNYIPVTTLCRTEAVRAAGGFRPHPDEHGSPCEDWGLWLAMADRGATFGHLAARTWRWHLDNDTTRGRPDRW